MGTEASGKKKRGDSRFRASFPIEVEGESGVTVDMSGSGIAFETERDYKVGDEFMVRIAVDRKKVASKLDLECRATVVRVDKTKKGLRVGATVEWSEDDVVNLDDTLI